MKTERFYAAVVAQPRSYRSPRRAAQAAQTRQVVLEAARTLFAERGWSGTGVRDVATAAGISVETVYAAVGTKAALFRAAYEGTIVGDNDPTPLADRAMFRAMGEGVDVAERAAVAAELITTIHRRSIGLSRALREGAASDPELAGILATDEAHRWTDDRRGMELVLRRPVTAAEVDAFWAVTSPEVYDLLTRRRGWADERYATFVARSFLDLAEEGEQPR